MSKRAVLGLLCAAWVLALGVGCAEEAAPSPPAPAPTPVTAAPNPATANPATANPATANPATTPAGTATDTQGLGAAGSGAPAPAGGAGLGGLGAFAGLGGMMGPPPTPDPSCPNFMGDAMGMPVDLVGCCMPEGVCGVISTLRNTCITSSPILPTLMPGGPCTPAP